jgi:hypothetical protein
MRYKIWFRSIALLIFFKNFNFPAEIREKWKKKFYVIIIFRYKLFFRNKKKHGNWSIILIFPLFLIFTFATTFFATEKYGVSEPVLFRCDLAVNTVKTGVLFRHLLQHRNSASASVVSTLKSVYLSVKMTLRLSYRVLKMTL